MQQYLNICDMIHILFKDCNKLQCNGWLGEGNVPYLSISIKILQCCHMFNTDLPPRLLLDPYSMETLHSINIMNSSHHTTLFHTSDATITNSFLQILSEIPFGGLLLAISTFVIIHSLSQRRRHGLAVWPVLGMLPSLLVGIRGNAYEWVTGVLVRTNGTFTFQGPWLSNLQCVVTANPDNLKYILKTKFTNFPKGEYIQGLVRDMLGHGIFSTDGEAWRHHRKRSSLQLHSVELRAAMAKSVIELTHSRLLPVLESLVNIPFDLQDVLLRLTFDNVCMIALGINLGCLSLGLPKMPFAVAFENMTEAIALRFITPTALWKAMYYFGVGGEGKIKRSLKQVDEFAYEVIRRRKAELSSLSGERSRSDLLTVFMRLKDENGNAFSDKFLRDLCMNFILAGRDTSSVALAWFFWLLDQNPEVEEEILAEVKRIIEERGYGGNGEGENTLVFRPEEVKRMEYLQAALSEALRLYPSVPVDFKEVTEDEVFPDGTTLKKGIKVMYSLYSMGRMESIWGEDCREFKPERWLKDGRFVSESWSKFPAFNGGPRVCLGKDFAYYQMKFVSASIIYQYHVKVFPNHPVVPKLALTTYMKHGLKVILEKR